MKRKDIKINNTQQLGYITENTLKTFNLILKVARNKAHRTRHTERNIQKTSYYGSEVLKSTSQLQRKKNITITKSFRGDGGPFWYQKSEFVA